MIDKRLKPETHIQINILSEKGYSTRPIATRLHLIHMTMARSIINFKAIGKNGFEKSTGCLKCTTKRLNDAIILSAKNSPRKTAKSI